MPPLQTRNLLYHYMFPFYLCFLSLFIIILPLKKNADSLELKFNWDSYEEEDNIVGYRIFCREEGQYYDYNNPIWEGTEKFCTLSNLDDKKIYYFVSRAFNIHGIESNDSNEKCYTPLNTPPVALEKSISAYVGTPTEISLTSMDMENNHLSYIIVNQPSHGILSGEAPYLTYTPYADYTGLDIFSFKVNDGVSDSNIAQIIITIYPAEAPPDDGPLADCSIYEDSEDGNIHGWIIYDEDPSGASISNVFDADRQGRVIELKGTFRSYCYLLHNEDGSKWNNSGQFTAGWSMKCSGYFIVYFNIHTTAGDKYLYYTPVDRDSLGAGYYIHHGLGSKVTDGNWYSFERNLQADLEDAQPGVSILEVNGFMIYGSGRVDDILLCNDISADSGDIPPNSPPIADNKSIITNEDTAVNITLTGTDTQNDPLTYTVITQPLHGTLSGTVPSLIYSPDADYNGPDNFTFKANDGQEDSGTATVNISVIPVNDVPVAYTQSLGADEDTALSIILTGRDIDGDLLTYIIATPPSHGTLSGEAHDLTYTPDADYNGPDIFSFKVNDGVADSNIAQIRITIYPVEDPPDDAPLADCSIYEDSEDGNIHGWIIYDEDPSGASISNVFDAERQDRVIELKGSFRDYYYLLHNEDGSKWNNSGQFILKWSMKYSNFFIIYIYIHTTAGDKYLYYTPVDRDSLGAGYYIHHGLGSKVTDGNWYSFERNLQADLEDAQPGVSILEVNGFMIYGSGRVDDILLCNDISADSDDIPPNSPPIADNKSIITNEDTAVNITLTGTDTQNDPLTYTVITQPLHGTLSGTVPSLIYSPDADYNGPDNFTFKANDGQEDSGTATVNISVIPVNDVPVAYTQSLGADEDTALSIILTGRDIDGDLLTYIIATPPSHGTLSGEAPDLTYTPYADYAGPDIFSFKVNDGVSDSNIAQIRITIYPVEDPPDDAPLADCSIYEDSEDGNIHGWIIYDEDPSGASISNVFDAERQDRVIELKGSFRDYCYLLHNEDGSKWNNSGQFTAGWSMKYSNYFIIYIYIHTTAGDKYLYYTPADLDTLGDGHYIHHGLGSKVTDGNWYSFERNLQADLEDAQPGVSILEVNGFMVYGSGRVDDILLCSDF